MYKGSVLFCSKSQNGPLNYNAKTILGLNGRVYFKDKFVAFHPLEEFVGSQSHTQKEQSCISGVVTFRFLII